MDLTTVRVRGFTIIRDVFGAAVVEVAVGSPETVGNVIDTLLSIYGQNLKEKLWDPSTQALTPFLIRLNDEIISSTFDMDRTVKSGDEMAIIFPIGGG